MVSGHLQVKKDIYYAVLSFKDATGKRVQPWISTGLHKKGNKKKAEEMLDKIRRQYVAPEDESISMQENFKDNISVDMLYADFVMKWLDVVKVTLKENSYATYAERAKISVIPYFQKANLTLAQINAQQIQKYYLHELERVSPNEVGCLHVLIHKSLGYAVKLGLIDYNPSDRVERPKPVHRNVDYYRSDELQRLFNAADQHPMGLPIEMTAFYGFRRSEVLGLKWDCIDFEKNTITVQHTVTTSYSNGKYIIIEQDSTKTAASHRTLPIMDRFRDRLLLLKKQQEENKELCKESYNMQYDGYVFVNSIGELIMPYTLSREFDKICQKAGLRHIRFHDLRHSCASLLVSNGVPMKAVQEWLGHSSMQTTANIYSHLDFSAKENVASKIQSLFSEPKQ